jgi:hypothetical protein
MSRIAENKKNATSLRGLLAGLIDYAGLFPPASVDMETAVTNYSRYIEGEHAWMLGRFIVPASRLSEFESKLNGKANGWRVSVLVADAAHEMPGIVEFNARHEGRCAVDAVELKAVTADDVAQARMYIHRSMIPYFEIDPANARALLPAIAEADGRAKIRTGGVTAGMFPSSAAIAGFMLDCLCAKVAFKATAGLHHPIRCMRPLTYEADAPTGVMHGFLNVFVAAVFARAGAARDRLVEILADENTGDLVFTDEGISWRDLRASRAQIQDAREHFASSFGSCSFEEPVSDLQSLSLL